MKESNKKNAEDAKICPQIHQTDVFFQMKIVSKGGSSISYFGNQNKQMVITPSSATPSPQMILPVLQPLQPPQSEAEKKKKNKNGENMEDNQTSEQRFFEEGNSAPSSSALKRKATEPRFINGMQVEVSLPDKHCCGAWFPATVIKKTKNKVDVFFYYGWWSGVITEVLPCNKCTVQFQHQSNRRTFNQNELRCHIEWISEESVQQLRDIGMQCNQGDVRQADQAHMCRTSLKYRYCCAKWKILHTTPTSKADLASPCKKFNKGEVTVQTMPQSGIHFSSDTPNPAREDLRRKEDTSHNLTDIITSPSNRCSGHPTLNFCQEKLRSHFDCDRSGAQTTVADSRFSSLSKIRGEPCDLSRSQLQHLQNNLTFHSSAHSINSVAGNGINHQKEETVGHSKQNVSEGSAGGISPDNRLTSSSTAVTLREESVAAINLKSPYGGNEIVMELNHNSDEQTLNNENMPFTKSYPVWKDVESMEVFRSIRQKPHFRPLSSRSEYFREGDAVGLMLNFANVVEKIRGAQLNDPKSALESKLEALKYFEDFGFNVQPIRARLEELLRVQDSQLQLAGISKQLEWQITEERNKEQSLNSQVDELNETLRELQESLNQISKERKMVEMEKQKKGSSIALLQQRLNDIKKDIQRTKLNFTCVAAAPL
ncbi:hypothetical protein IFM89_009109 [Coptis chinensis]|uniref:Agenet domain-containing protein n=1 Tax=Coptis chinensis TaxID=261450 RepID=A0A835LQS9_9MAGN|nr:hypothetical protein IFM89_009109 [Coptis chinensis]